MTYDSTVDTQQHIRQVADLLHICSAELVLRAQVHDASKLRSPEKEIFDEVTPLLRGLTYGSDEYKAMLERIKPALDHHYACNSHHPEHYQNGIQGMSLLDLLEMLCDWLAATKRHADGDILRSIELNQKRFGYSDELKRILLNSLVSLQGESEESPGADDPKFKLHPWPSLAAAQQHTDPAKRETGHYWVQRETGHYWVQREDGNWWVAYWDAPKRGWHLIGTDESLSDDFLGAKKVCKIEAPR